MINNQTTSLDPIIWNNIQTQLKDFDQKKLITLILWLMTDRDAMLFTALLKK
jgi:hypothetical protein